MATPTTANRGYQKPDPANTLAVDVLRLVAALDSIDTDIHAVLAGALTLAGVKTFSSSPVIPTPATNDNTTKAASTAFVQTAVAAAVLTLTTELSTKAESSHTHTIANVTGLQSALDSKAASSHAHAIGEVTGLQAALDGKAETGHSHARNVGSQVQQVFATTNANTTLSTVIPADSTAPQSTEGTQVLTASITPTSASNWLVVDVTVYAAETSNVGDLIIAALFRDSGADAVAVGTIGGMNGGGNYLTAGVTVFRYRVAAGATTATTFTVRVGNNAGAAALNVSHQGHNFGGLLSSTLTVTEVQA